MKQKIRLVCTRCRRPWRGIGSPARCVDCGETSFAISLPVKRGRPPKIRQPSGG